jgi:hypothetical protein
VIHIVVDRERRVEYVGASDSSERESLLSAA